MALPIAPLPTGEAIIGGETVVYHSMTRSQALRLNSFKGAEDEAEVFILQCGTGCTEEDARAFRDGNDTETAGLLIDAILVLSGLAEPDPDPKV
jgi:hypothetical protein